jgi:hypothetical protein
VIRFLVEKYPEAFVNVSSKGLSPIHYAVSNKEVNLDILDFLSEVVPRALTAVLPNGNTWLHHVLSAPKIHENVVMWIVKSW